VTPVATPRRAALTIAAVAAVVLALLGVVATRGARRSVTWRRS
jgi:hypothetical protein